MTNPPLSQEPNYTRPTTNPTPSRGRSRSRGNDPALKTPGWRNNITYWRQARRPCARCGRPIDYDNPTFTTDHTGRRRANPMALVVGHIVSRQQAKAQGWTIEMMNHISNTQPEHIRCSAISGAKEKRKSRNAPRLKSSRSWL